MIQDSQKAVAKFSRQDSTAVLTVGFVAIVLLLAAVAAVGLTHMALISANLKEVVNEQNTQIDLATTMRNAARERSMLLFGMAVTADPFQRDDQFMALRANGAEFVKTRQKLLEHKLTEQERAVLQKQDEQSDITAQHQYRVIELLQAEDFESATQELLQGAVPMQNRAVTFMEEFVRMQHAQNQKALKGATQGFRQGYMLMLVLGAAALTLSALVVGFVRRRIAAMMNNLSLAGSQLEEANEQLEQRVQQRTGELQQVNESLQAEVNERQQTQAALAQSEARYRKFLEQFHGIAFQADMDLRLFFLHGAVEEISGYTEEELVSQRPSWQDIVDPEDLERYVAEEVPSLRANPGHKVEWQFRITRKNGERRWLRAFIQHAVPDDGRPSFLEGAIYDVTDRERAAQALRDSEAKLREQAEQLAEADRRKDEFLAMLAHELRNPLAPIHNAVELLKRQRLGSPETLEWAVEVIARQSTQMTRLVDDLLVVARITKGKLELRREPIDLVDVLTNAVETIRPLIAGRKQRLLTSLPEEPVSMIADGARMSQVAVNLLNNAVKYSEPGGRIWISLERQGDEAVLEVSDEGAGIADDVLPHIFEPFSQADHSLERAQGGLGLGLTLVRQLVELHSGSVEAFSDGPGCGTVFRVRLPMSGELSSPQATDPAERDLVEPQPRRVLVVEDNMDVAMSFYFLLESLGHQIKMVHDGQSALDAVGEFEPEVIFLDIGLPEMDGYEVARRLRERFGNGRFTLVALTGYGQEEDRGRSKQAGFDRHLLKPADMETLENLFASLGPR